MNVFYYLNYSCSSIITKNTYLIPDCNYPSLNYIFLRSNCNFLLLSCYFFCWAAIYFLLNCNVLPLTTFMYLVSIWFRFLFLTNILIYVYLFILTNIFVFNLHFVNCPTFWYLNRICVSSSHFVTQLKYGIQVKL